MIEVFKTNVWHRDHAAIVIEEICKAFSDYTANFDLEDCDKILRVQCPRGVVQSYLIISLLKDLGFEVEVLADVNH